SYRGDQWVLGSWMVAAGREGGRGMPKVNGTLIGYYCDDCEEWLFLERPACTSEIYCPFCRDQTLAIDSDDLSLLEEIMKEDAK
ncbi:hypothetical protein ACFRC1_40625, partial [Streptomyces sp. NPDC056626]